MKYGYEIKLCNEEIAKVFGEFKYVPSSERIAVFKYDNLFIKVSLFLDKLYIIAGNSFLKITDSYFETIGGNVRFFNGNFEWTLNLTKGRIEVNISNVQRCFERKRLEISRMMKKWRGYKNE